MHYYSHVHVDVLCPPPVLPTYNDPLFLCRSRASGSGLPSHFDPATIHVVLLFGVHRLACVAAALESLALALDPVDEPIGG